MKLRLVLALVWLLTPVVLRAAEPTADQLKFFETQVRPLLAENCFSCHGEKKQKGDLRLDSRAAILKGGKNGAVLTPGIPSKSKLIVAVGYQDEDLQMPPDDPLPADQVELLARWVQMGAPWPVEEPSAVPATRSKQRKITDEDRAFWSFQPLKDSAVPPIEGTWARNPIDHFILAKLKQERLTPAPEADRAALIRRVTFDLHGLPPTAEEVDAFVNDPSPKAYENLVDRLLASPRYGEHWARHWFDIVRYAESDGYKQDAYRSNAWPYRDYVIKSFNNDKPYDRFVTEQLAGDEIAPDDPEVIVATGYLRAGMYEYNARHVRRQWEVILTEVTDVTGDAFLGLSMQCARCHNHKFDPILQTDYFRLQAFFAPMLPRQDILLGSPEQKAAWLEKAAPIRAQIDAIEQPLLRKAGDKRIEVFPPDIRVMYHKSPAQRAPLEEQLVQLAARQFNDDTEIAKLKPTGADGPKLEALRAQLVALEEERPAAVVTGLVVTDVGPVAPPTLIPGDPKKQSIKPGYPTVMEQLPLPPLEIAPTATSTGRRTALAKWITDPRNPLTTRVIVNRIWQYHFGRGIVGTSGDFGKLGDRPTHPELLDWLALRFVEQGWSFKAMHRMILLSATYRQTALRPPPEIAKMRDPENRWLWRFNTRRLDAEQIRDAMLAVSGDLDATAAGPSAEPTSNRRSVYLKMLRNARDPLLDVFDLAEPFGSIPNRNITTTANQALLMMNGAVPLKRAADFAERLTKLGLSDRSAIVEEAYRLAYARTPRDDERTAAIQFLGGNAPMPAKADKALVDFCHVLMNSSEFLFVD
jgi:hypothetical protein